MRPSCALPRGATRCHRCSHPTGGPCGFSSVSSLQWVLSSKSDSSEITTWSPLSSVANGSVLFSRFFPALGCRKPWRLPCCRDRGRPLQTAPGILLSPPSRPRHSANCPMLHHHCRRASDCTLTDSSFALAVWKHLAHTAVVATGQSIASSLTRRKRWHKLWYKLKRYICNILIQKAQKLLRKRLAIGCIAAIAGRR